MEISGAFPRHDAEVIARFSRLGVADVGEAMDGFGLLALTCVVPGSRIAGHATTFITPPGQNLALQVALLVARAGDVIVGSALGSSTALWGMTVTIAAQARGVVAAVVDGSARDVADIRAAQFPVWSSSISPRGARKDVFGAVNVPIVCAGIAVRPGDVILADDDGVAVVPFDGANDILMRAEERRRREQEMLPDLRAGVTPFELLGLAQTVSAQGVTIVDTESSA